METNLNDIRNVFIDRRRWNGTLQHKCFSTLFSCLWFIVENAINTLPDNYTGNILNELFKIMSGNDGMVGNDFSILYDFVRIMAINLIIGIIDKGRKYYRPYNTLTQQPNQQYRSFIIFNKQNENFYVAYMLSSDDKKHTALSINDPYIYEQLEDFRQTFNRLSIPQERVALSQDAESIDDAHESTEMVMLDDDHVTNSATLPIIGEENRRQNRQDTNIVPLESGSLSTTTNTIFSSTSYQNEIIDLSKPELLNQPKRLWHDKYLPGGVTRPLVNIQVEGLGQRSRLQINLTQVPDEYIGRVYIGVRVVDYYYQQHAQNIVVPARTMVKENHKCIMNKLKCFKFDEENPDTFGEETRCVYSKITKKEKQNEIKEMAMAMVICFNNEITIENKQIKWSKLEFTYYRKTRKNKFISVSPSTYSDLIQQNGDSDDAYENNGLIREFLCKNGGQIIVIKLDEIINKKYLYVYSNNKYLDETEFQVAKNYVSFVSPEGIPGTELHVVIQIINGNNITDIKELKLPYRAHDNHPDPCDEFEHLFDF